MDRFAQLGAAATLEAVEDAELKINGHNSERVAVLISSGIGGIITLSEQIGVMDAKGASRVSPFLVPMMLPDMASGQVSMMLGAKGTQLLPRLRLLQRGGCHRPGAGAATPWRRGHRPDRGRGGRHLPHWSGGIQRLQGLVEA